MGMFILVVLSVLNLINLDLLIIFAPPIGFSPRQGGITKTSTLNPKPQLLRRGRGYALCESGRADKGPELLLWEPGTGL